MSRSRIILLLVTGLALALPAVCAAATEAPHSGYWRIAGGGGFHIGAHGRSLAGLHLAGGICGLTQVTVLGRQPIRMITEGGASNWVVGFADPGRKNPDDLHGLVGQKVRIRSGSRTLAARLDIVFAVGGSAPETSGDLLVNGCDLAFDAGR